MRPRTALGPFSIFVVLLGACMGDTREAQEPEQNVTLALELRTSTTTTDASPLGPVTDLVMSPRGEVVYFAALGSGKTLVITDSLGGTIGEVGPRGAGPGEVTTPLVVDISDSSVTAVDLLSLRVTEWRRDGAMIRTLQLTRPVLPRVQVAGRWIGLGASATGFTPAVMRSTTGEDIPLLGAQAPLLDSLLAAAGQRHAPSIGGWNSGFIVGDGLTYRIGVFDSTGALVRRYSRDLGANKRSAERVTEELEAWVTDRTAKKGRPSPAEISAREEKLRSEELPWFSHVSPLRIDSTERLWIVGTTRDSVFADVLNPSGAVERHWLDCPGFEGRWAHAEGWLALVCAAPEEAVYAAVVKRYRILPRP